ncbi:MAG: hypothetical protein U0271_33300 [Polyangiaceae bacterium]
MDRSPTHALKRAVATAAMLTVVSALAALMLGLAYRAWGPNSVGFAAAVVWAPMMWLGSVSHVRAPSLPRRFHAIRPFEKSGRLYELLGVHLVKRLLRRGPARLWNPGLRLPEAPSAESITRLEGRMLDAEATHAVLFVLSLGCAVHAALSERWVAAAATFVFNIVVNGYPTMLQRYNRVLLRRRFPATPVAHQPVRRIP